MVMTTVQAQPFNWQWAYSDTATLSSPNVADMVTDAMGNTYVFGQYYGSVSFGGLAALNSLGQSDLFIVKYDNAGSAIWATSAGGTDFDVPQDIAVDGSGNVYITGWFHSDPINFGGTTHNVVGQRDIYVARIDGNSGGFVWSNRYGSNDFQNGHLEAGNAIACDASGNVYVSGGFRYTLDVTGLPTLQGCSQYYTGFLLKVDPNGTGIWSRRTDCTKHWSYGASEGQQLEISPGGHLYLGLRARGDTIFFETDTIINQQISGQAHDALLASYDLNGNYQWVRGIGGYGYDDVQALASDAQGNCYIALHREGSYGYLGIPGIAISGNLGTYKNVVLKYTVNGDLLWGTRMGNSTYDHDIEAMQLESDDKLLVAGWHQGNFQFDSIMPTVGINGNYGIWLARYDSSSVLQEYFNTRSSSPRGFRGIGMDALGNTYLVGYFRDSLQIPGLPLMDYSAGTTAMFLTRFGAITTTIAPIPTRTSGVTIYPVPSDNMVHLQAESPFSKVTVYTATGALVREVRVRGTRTTFRDLASGYYVAAVEQEGRVERVAFIVR
jgi:hypothetical protein